MLHSFLLFRCVGFLFCNSGNRERYFDKNDMGLLVTRLVMVHDSDLTAAWPGHSVLEFAYFADPLHAACTIRIGDLHCIFFLQTTECGRLEQTVTRF